MNAAKHNPAPHGCPNVGQLIDILLRGDFARGLSAFCEDVVWHVTGETAVAGVHRGREAMLALLELLFTEHARGGMVTRRLGEQDTYRIEWIEISDSSCRPRTGWPLVSRLEGGRVREVWWCRSGALFPAPDRPSHTPTQPPGNTRPAHAVGRNDPPST